MPIDAAVAGAAIGGAATLIGAGTSAVGQSSLNRKTREFNREEAEKQREWSEMMYNKQNAWNYEMWLNQNEYNSPVNQVKRLQEAGLNPMYYGLDGSSAGNVNSAQPLGYERANAGNQINPFQGFGDIAGKAAQISLALSSANKAEKEADLAAEKAITESLLRDRQYDFLGVQIDLAKSGENLNNAQIRKVSAEILTIEKQVEKMDADILEAYSRIDVAQRGQKLAEDTFEFTKALESAKLSLQEKEIAIQWYNANTQRIVAEADIDLKEAQKVYVGLEGDQVKAVTATEEALRAGKVERQTIENKTAEREYKWMPVDKTVKAVSTAAGIAGGLMLGTGVTKYGLKTASKTIRKRTLLYDANGNPTVDDQSTTDW